ncbi:hypothetical protein RN001_001399 [Aquatica leii]|uniref:Uncharacterized protein n=1 Tax=Aquatica leii TaxID=1421715 RepID=A0AAN7PG91_9COLE|nr:hypothetical protein RN001_001399 [Aquatica leii]
MNGLTLNDLLAELEEDIHGTSASHDIAILPPTNANDDLTDEDSGDEQDRSINNLPASQLLAEAELFNTWEPVEVRNRSITTGAVTIAISAATERGIEN